MSFEQSDEALGREKLACEFRKRFLRGLKRLYAKGELQLPRTLEFADVDSPEAFEEWLGPLSEKMWMVDLQETADHKIGPSNLLRYLAKYFTGAAIRDARLLSDDGVHVTIGIRDYRNQCRDEVTMPGSEFVRRFLLHIVPSGVERIRYAGIFHPRKRDEKLARCRRLMLGNDPLAVGSTTSVDESHLSPCDANDSANEKELDRDDPEYSEDEHGMLPMHLLSAQPLVVVRTSKTCCTRDASDACSELLTGESLTSIELRQLLARGQKINQPSQHGFVAVTLEGQEVRPKSRLPTCRRCGSPEMIPERYRNWLETDNTIRQVKWLMALFAVTWTTLDELVDWTKSAMKKRLQRPSIEQRWFTDAFNDYRRSFVYTTITIDAVSNPAQPVLFNTTPFDQLDPSLPLPNW